METKPYLVIARKYRPQTFEEVVGQDHIVTTLKNAVTLGRVGHAYLFTGPRGVGKTSMARIFAKALNCQKGPTATPCGKCQACVEIEESRSLDVFEIDGASNRGIDEIRALRENVKFSPAAGKFKIYIIDEVHQITPDGFNALLKTLEEPPAHVKFIFATTATHKVPATILSRCQRFDFRRILTEEIARTLKEICKKEKIRVDDDALFVIAKAADGSLRDSQSILDQMASLDRDHLSKKEVLQSLGALEEERLFDITEALAKQDARQALLIFDGVLKEGKDAGIFLESLLEHVRNLLFVQVSEKLADLVDASESYKKSLLDQKSRFTRDDLFYFFSVIAHTLQIQKRFEKKNIPIEMALIKLAHRAPTESLSEILERLNSAEKKTPKIDLTELPEREEQEELPGEDVEISPARPQNQSATVDSVWQPLLRLIKSEKISVASYLADAEPSDFKNGVVRIAFPDKKSFHREFLETDENTKLVEKHLSSLLEQMVRVQFESVKELSGKNLSGDSAQSADTAPAADPESDGVIKSAMNLFGGRVIRS